MSIIVVLVLFLVHKLYFLYVERTDFSLDVLSVYLFLFMMILSLSKIGIRIDMIFRKHKSTILTISVLLAIVWFNKYYFDAGGFRDNKPAFMGFSDQGSYYRMISSLVNGTFERSDYFYGLGYPVLGSIFYHLYENDPLFYVNFICYLLIIIYFYNFSKYFLKRELHVFFITTFLVINPYLVEYLVVPWTSTITLMTYSYSLYIFLKQKATVFEYALLGLCAGLTFATRYVDIILFLPIGIYLLSSEIISYKFKGLLRILPAIVISFSIALGVFYSHKVYFGDYFENPYKLHHHPSDKYTDGDFSYYYSRLGANIIENIYGQLVEGKTPLGFTYQHSIYKELMESVFQKNFLFLFFPAGFVLMLMNKPYLRLKLSALLIGVLLFLFIYSLHPGTCSGCMIFHSTHYFKPLIPLFMIGGCYYIVLILSGSYDYMKLFLLGALNLLIYIILAMFIGLSITHSYEVKLYPSEIYYDKLFNILITPKNLYGSVLKRAGDKLSIVCDTLDDKNQYRLFEVPTDYISEKFYWSGDIVFPKTNSSYCNLKINGVSSKTIDIQ
jgi:hypothetical protein